MDGETLHKTHKTNPEGSSVDIVDDPGGVKSRAPGHFVDFVHEFGRTVAFVRKLAEDGVLIRLAEDGGIEVDAPGGWLADSRIAELRERRESLRLFVELAMDRVNLGSPSDALAACDALDELVAAKLREAENLAGDSLIQSLRGLSGWPLLNALRGAGAVLWIDGNGSLAYDCPSDELARFVEANRVGLIGEVRKSGTRAHAEECRPVVVNLNRREPFDVLVNRKSDWGNPFIMGPDGPRAVVIRKFQKWLPNQPELMRELRSLRGKRIACHCVPLDCHGHILADFVVAEAHEELERAFVARIAKGLAEPCPLCGWLAASCSCEPPKPTIEARVNDSIEAYRALARDVEPSTIRLLDAQFMACSRCRGVRVYLREIHDGESVRADCACCGISRGLPAWYERELAQSMMAGTVVPIADDRGRIVAP